MSPKEIFSQLSLCCEFTGTEYIKSSTFCLYFILSRLDPDPYSEYEYESGSIITLRKTLM